MVVASPATDCQAEPHRARRLNSIDDVLNARLFSNAPAFAVQHVVPVKARRDKLILSRAFQVVAGNLLDRKLVERHVRIQRPDHPVPPRPQGPRPVLLVTIRVGVASRVEPGESEVLAESRRRQQSVDGLFISLRRVVAQKRVELVDRRWQPGQVERHSPQERVLYRAL